MGEAKSVLRGCCASRDVDVVVARRGGAFDDGVAEVAAQEQQRRPSESPPQPPLSLLAAHDEHDLINLSSVPLRPAEETSAAAQKSTIIRIGDDGRSETVRQGAGRTLPKMPSKDWEARRWAFV